MPDIADVDHRAIDFLDRQIVELRNICRAAVKPHVIFPLAHLRGAGGQYYVLGVKGARHVRRRDALCQHLLRVEINHDAALFATIG